VNLKVRNLKTQKNTNNKKARNAAQIIGEEPVIRGLSSFSDARFYWEAGIPVCTYGPAPKVFWESNAHGPDENVVIDDLIKCVKVLALTAVDLLT